MAPVLGEVTANGSEALEDSVLSEILADESKGCPDSPVSTSTNGSSKENGRKSRKNPLSGLGLNLKERKTNTIIKSNPLKSLQSISPFASDESDISLSSDSVYLSEKSESTSQQEYEELASISSGESAKDQLLKARAQMEVLKEVIREKDEHINQLQGQLRRATSSKCDLVVACTEIERQKELVEKQGEFDVKEIQNMNKLLLEQQAIMECEFINEIAILTERIREMQLKHQQTLKEKDFEVTKAEEQLRRLSVADASGNVFKVKKDIWNNEKHKKIMMAKISTSTLI
mmetsp:Transcript_8721/g.12334  ORF Transcript_8721/g.12334 Transcript_8721/m.12334 type:complete len:288 (+) Transcript_8721:106-969(+)